MNPDDALAEFTRLTDGSLGDARDFLSLTPEQQQQAIWNYRHMSWAQDPDRLGAILQILGVIGTVAADLTGVGGAISAFKVLV